MISHSLKRFPSKQRTPFSTLNLNLFSQLIQAYFGVLKSYSTTNGDDDEQLIDKI